MAFKVKGYLRVQEPEINFAIEEQEIDAYGKFKLKTSKSGRKSKSNLYLYTEKEATLSLSYDSIETDKRIYVFHTYVLFAFTEDAKTHHVNIENQLLDIYAFGANMNEAKQDLFEQFDYTYRRLNQFSNKKLSSHLLDAKTYINLIVDKIKEK